MEPLYPPLQKSHPPPHNSCPQRNLTNNSNGKSKLAKNFRISVTIEKAYMIPSNTPRGKGRTAAHPKNTNGPIKGPFVSAKHHKKPAIHHR